MGGNDSMRHFFTFSEAIREGAKLRPVQAFHRFFDVETGGTCANGAALEAIFGEPFTNELLEERRYEVVQVMRSDFSYLIGLKVEVPCECNRLHNGPAGEDPTGRRHRPDNIAVHLNNYHKWTREAIADWLESEEEKLGYVTLTESEAPESNLYSLEGTRK
jgi:hypothetical protein